MKMDEKLIFFSHSSKDALPLKYLKESLEQKFKDSGTSIKIFMSSDGQSIPGGFHSIKTIEKGLKDSQLVFIFMTPNSLESNWVWFEAGFSYLMTQCQTDKKVIPLGIGIKFEQLGPLAQLQGYDLTSLESLNNLIYNINQKFGTNCDDFTDREYDEIFQHFNIVSPITEYVFTFKLKAYNPIYNSAHTKRFILNYQKSCVQIESTPLKDGSIPLISYTLEGIKFTHNNGLKYTDIEISPLNFEKSFKVLMRYLSFSISSSFDLIIKLNPKYSINHRDIDLSALLSQHDISKSDNYYGLEDLHYNLGTIDFRLKSLDDSHEELAIRLKDDTVFEDVIDLVKILLQIGIIEEKEKIIEAKLDDW